MTNHEDIVIVSAVRTPFSRFNSAMADIPSIDLGVIVMKEAVRRVGIKPEEVDDLYYGSCIPAEYALELDVPARQATLLSGFPAENISVTLDRACCSSLTALRLGVMSIRAGEARTVMAVGSENMPRTPHLAPGLRGGKRLGHIKLVDCLYELGYQAKGFNSVARDAGEVAVEHGITREMQDAWALGSQEKYAKAYADGKFKVGEELIPVVIPRKKGDPIVIDRDESPRETSLEALAKLKPIKLLAGGDEKAWRQLLEKTNVNGGAIAMGHPVGASAARITMTMAYELARRGGGYGVAAICGGLAQGEAVILKV
jgi:acetyl-CoA C-acetyltransferase